MATFNPRCWETEREQLGEAHVLIVVTVHEISWQLVGRLSQAVIHQESHQTHRKAWRLSQHSQGKGWSKLSSSWGWIPYFASPHCLQQRQLVSNGQRYLDKILPTVSEYDFFKKENAILLNL